MVFLMVYVLLLDILVINIIGFYLRKMSIVFFIIFVNVIDILWGE